MPHNHGYNYGEPRGDIPKHGLAPYKVKHTASSKGQSAATQADTYEGKETMSEMEHAGGPSENYPHKGDV